MSKHVPGLNGATYVPCALAWVDFSNKPPSGLVLYGDSIMPHKSGHHINPTHRGGGGYQNLEGQIIYYVSYHDIFIWRKISILYRR